MALQMNMGQLVKTCFGQDVYHPLLLDRQLVTVFILLLLELQVQAIFLMEVGLL